MLSSIAPCEEAPITPGKTPPQLMSELLQELEHSQVKNFAALKSKASLLADLLNKSPDDITIQDVEDIRPSLRSHLVNRRLAENSIRTYVNEVRFLMRQAKLLGWSTSFDVPPAWRNILKRRTTPAFESLARHLIARTPDPALVTSDDVESWIFEHVKAGGSLSSARVLKCAFSKVMSACGYKQLRKPESVSIPFEQFPDSLKADVRKLLSWKTAVYAKGRSKKQRVRAVTSSNTECRLGCLYGFAVNVLGVTGIESMSDLFNEDIVCEYADWALNKRGLKGQSVYVTLTGIGALMQNPKFQSLRGTWFKELLGAMPIEDEGTLRDRRAAKQVPYDVAARIPKMVRMERKNAQRLGPKHLAATVRDELLMQWLVILPWRNRNLRECRVEGSRPNVFKAPLDSNAPVTKPEWVESALQADPHAQFWQFKFSKEETKAGNDVHALLPRPLIPLLEEYMIHRQCLSAGQGSEALFLGRTGRALDITTVEDLVTEYSIRYADRAINPHSFRHIVAYGWLKDHPADYLTVSKILFHRSIETTLRIYASRFNESDGACGMERWFESRQQ